MNRFNGKRKPVDGRIRCPECDDDLSGNFGRVPAVVDGGLRVAIECSVCSTPLEIEAGRVAIVPVGVD